MSAQHTKGPWSADMATYRAPMIVNRTGKMTIANSINGETSAECDANARLIAAAPDLLSALELAHKCISDHAGDSVMAGECMDVIEDAIARARGKEGV